MSTRTTPTTGGAIRVRPWTRGNRLVGYDLELKRLWVGGQRLHHGATGVALAVAGLARLSRSRRSLAWALAGSALVAHDWKDRSLWFAGGPQAD